MEEEQCFQLSKIATGYIGGICATSRPPFVVNNEDRRNFPGEEIGDFPKLAAATEFLLVFFNRRKIIWNGARAKGFIFTHWLGPSQSDEGLIDSPAPRARRRICDGGKRPR